MADKPTGLVDMELPKGTMTGLMKVLAPLLMWMSVGWFAYPYLIGDIASAAGETIDMDELKLFSFIMAGVCLGLGIMFLALGFGGKKVDENDFKRMTGELVICKHCKKEIEKDITIITCTQCGKYL